MCQWEQFDIDMAGCVLCGIVHECCKQKCKDVAITDDSVVCTITGLCVSTSSFALHEYSDNVVVYSGPCDVSDVTEARMCRVEAVVLEFMTSQAARNVFAFENLKRMHKFYSNTMRSLRQGTANMVQIVQHALQLEMQQDFNEDMRLDLAALCTRSIQHVMCITHVQFGLYVKDSDVRSFVIGMIYLLCRGVDMHGVEILPRIPKLRNVLPSENNIARFFHCRSKYITETENKFKFAFRYATVDKLRMIFS